MAIRLATAFLVTVLAAGTAAAQGNAPPSRIGNVYDGTAHQPNPATVHENESAAGIAPSAPAARADDKTVQQLNQQIQTNGAQSLAPAKSLACASVPATCR